MSGQRGLKWDLTHDFLIPSQYSSANAYLMWAFSTDLEEKYWMKWLHWEGVNLMFKEVNNNSIQMKDVTSYKMKMIAETIYSQRNSKFIDGIYLVSDSEE